MSDQYADYFAMSGDRIEPGNRVSFPTYPKGRARGVVEISERVQIVVNGVSRPALAVRTDHGTPFDLPTKNVRLLQRGPVADREQTDGE